jgi:mutator protein MutT
MGERPVIVGAAVLRERRLLAARRSAPAALAGGWEFPGGKVEPGESEHEALVRECREELGVGVVPGGRLGADVLTRTGAVLRVWLATLDPPDAQPRALQDHDELRWLEPGALSAVPWLPADWPIVHALAARLVEAVPLAGGRVGGAVRIGDTVRRPSGSWTDAVHDLLAHLHGHRVPALVEPLGRDPEGREVLRYVPGRTVGAAAEVPPEFRAPALLRQLGVWLRQMHVASASFPAEPRDWRRGRRGLSPGLVVCHNDVSPANLVLHADGTLAAVLDWDMAAPAHPLDDVAFATWQFALRSHEPLDVEAVGVQALAEGYGIHPSVVLDRVGARMAGAARVIRAGAGSGDEGLQRLVAAGVPDVVEAEAARVAERRPALAAALNRRPGAAPRG